MQLKIDFLDTTEQIIFYRDCNFWIIFIFVKYLPKISL